MSDIEEGSGIGDESFVAGRTDGNAERPAYRELDGIRFYGKELDPVQANEVRTMQTAGPEAEQHLARHFTALPGEYRASLVGAQYETKDFATNQMVTREITDETLDRALATKGSKFFERIPNLEHPRALLELVKAEAIQRSQAGELQWLDGGFCKKTFFTIEMPSEVGTDGVVRMDQLTPEQQQAARENAQARGKLAGDEFKVSMAKGVTGPTSRKISVVLGWINGTPSPVVFTAYPGELAADFPKDQQADEERNYNQQFWAERAFIA